MELVVVVMVAALFFYIHTYRYNWNNTLVLLLLPSSSSFHPVSIRSIRSDPIHPFFLFRHVFVLTTNSLILLTHLQLF